MPIDFTPDPALYPFTSRWFSSSVGRVHHVDEGDGPPILLLHGNPTWSFLYRNIIGALRDRFRCVAVDYPGFGLSVRPEGYGYTAAEHAGVVGELVDHLDLRDLVVMGQDWGGPIGGAVALERPERIGGFVWGNTFLGPPDRLRVKLFSQATRSGPLRWAILERNAFMLALRIATDRKLTPREMEHYRAVQPSPADRVGVAELPRQLLDAHRLLTRLRDELPERLGDRPTLLVWGMRDLAFPPATSIPAFRRMFGDLELVALERAKHFIQEDAPGEIADAIVRRFG